MKNTLLDISSAVIVIHESTHGPGHDLRDFLLKNKVKTVLFIAHPLLYLPENYKNSSRFELYENGKLIKKENAFHWVLPEVILYIKDIIYTIFWSFQFCRRVDLFVGFGNLNALAGLVLKLLGGTKSVIFYVIDYVPKRFQNSLLNGVYHWIERCCAKYATWTWNLSPRMIEAREKKWNYPFPNQLVVPHGVHFSRIKRVPFSHINKSEILYMGSLLEKQGIQLVIRSLPEVLLKISNIKFTIIGKGPYEDELKRLVKKLHLENHVEFLGYIKNHHEMENRIARAAVAVALYDKKYDDFSYYADPGKIKNYLGAGVPVIMTDVPYIAMQVKEKQCGFIINYDKKSCADILTHFLSNKTLLEQYRYNAIEFAKQYEWEKVFRNALKYAKR